MNKQEILLEINKAKEHLANMEKVLKECEYERWRPEYKQAYYTIGSINDVYSYPYVGSDLDKQRENFFNCFQTLEQAKAEAEKILVRRMLEDIARRLNKGRKNIFGSSDTKYFLTIDNANNIGFDAFDLDYRYRTQGTIYCLDINFKDVAIQEIGEERLKKYLRGE